MKRSPCNLGFALGFSRSSRPAPRRQHLSPLCSLSHAPSSCVSPRICARIPATTFQHTKPSRRIYPPPTQPAGSSLVLCATAQIDYGLAASWWMY
jgi:hypothetical protein